MMRSTITSRGQTVIPAEIRRRFRLTTSDRLEWIVVDDRLTVIPVRANAIEAFRGQGKGGAVRRLLAERQDDKKAE
ncbi:MAG: AbrB/MazE/SpoVT family DNA-binding domain-containing protein [Thiohalomonadales bacterium]